MNNGCHWLRLIAAYFCLLTLFGLSPQADAMERLRLNGTGGAVGLISRLSALFEQQNPDIRIEINLPATGSGGGIKGVLAGALDLAFSARPLKEGELAQGLMERPFAKTPFVMAVASSNDQVNTLSTEELVAIYAGKTTTWPDGSRLRLILRPLHDSDNGLLRGLSPAMDQAIMQALSRKGMAMGMNDQESADLIERIDGAIGTTLLALLTAENRSGLRPLAVNGVSPTLENLAAGHYPLAKTFFLICRSQPSPPVRRFLQFVNSPQAKQIIGANGCLEL